MFKNVSENEKRSEELKFNKSWICLRCFPPGWSFEPNSPKQNPPRRITSVQMRKSRSREQWSISAEQNQQEEPQDFYINLRNFLTSGNIRKHLETSGDIRRHQETSSCCLLQPWTQRTRLWGRAGSDSIQRLDASHWGFHFLSIIIIIIRGAGFYSVEIKTISFLHCWM